MKDTMRPSVSMTWVTKRCSGEAPMTGKLGPSGSKFWLFNTPKRVPRAILRKATKAWFSSLRLPSWIQVLRKSNLPPAEPPTNKQGNLPDSYNASMKKDSDADKPSNST